MPVVLSPLHTQNTKSTPPSNESHAALRYIPEDLSMRMSKENVQATIIYLFSMRKNSESQRCLCKNVAL